MPAGTVQSLRELLEGAENISDSKLSRALASAGRRVRSDDVPQSHESFADLQEYYAAHLLEVSGVISGALTAKSVGDVSLSFSTNNESGWLVEYRRLRAQVIGIRRIV